MRRFVILAAVAAGGCAEERCPDTSSETLIVSLTGDVAGTAVALVVNEPIKVGNATPDANLGRIVSDGRFGDEVFRVVADGDDGTFIVVEFFGVTAAGDYAVGPGAPVDLSWTGAPGGHGVSGTVHIGDATVGAVRFVAEFAIDVDGGAAEVEVVVGADNDEGGCV